MGDHEKKPVKSNIKKKKTWFELKHTCLWIPKIPII